MAFVGGLGLVNCWDGKLSMFASTHIGPETPGNDDDLRFLNSIVTTVKISDKLTSITDMTYTHDEAADANAYGVAQYFTYALNDKVTLGLRGEVFKDDEGFYVAQFNDYGDPVRALDGRPLVDTTGAGANTYLAVTAGLTYKVTENIRVRPEVRWDHSTASDAFNDFSDSDMLTAGLDVIVNF